MYLFFKHYKYIHLDLSKCIFFNYFFLLQTDLNSELKKEKNELRDKEAVSLY